MANTTNEQKRVFFDNEEQKKEYLGQLEKGVLSQRFYDIEQPRDRIDGQFQRDYSRIMYASSFRRLQGKMQL